MERTTIMLPPELKARALRRARESGKSLGELMREALEVILREEGEKTRDPFFADTAVFEGPAPSDLSANLDHYLYDEDEA